MEMPPHSKSQAGQLVKLTGCHCLAITSPLLSISLGPLPIHFPSPNTPGPGQMGEEGCGEKPGVEPKE